MQKKIQKEIKKVEKHVLKLRYFIGFVFSYVLFFYFMGHFDALDNVNTAYLIFFGLSVTRGDVYFISISMLIITLFLSVLFAFKVAQNKVLSYREFIGFTGIATLILPISVWGLAWIQWFALRPDGTLTLWEVGAIRIAVDWQSFMPVHIGLTIFFFAFTALVVFYKIWRNKKKN
jgi:hypothetical protein